MNYIEVSASVLEPSTLSISWMGFPELLELRGEI